METFARRGGLVLSKEARECYEEWQNALEKSLAKLGIETPFLNKIKNPDKFIKLIEKVELCGEIPKDANVREEMSEIRKRLNSIFLIKDNLPGSIQSKQDLTAIANWMEKDFGVKINTAIMHEGEDWGTEGPLRVTYRRGTSALECTVAMLHEMNHVRNPSCRELMKRETESVFSYFYPDERISMACREYFDGRAVYSYTKALKSSDMAVVAHAAVRLLELLAMPPPEFYLGMESSRKVDHKMEGYGEGLRRYIELIKKIGKERLEEFEEECARRYMVPGLDDGSLVAVDPKKRKMFRVDMEGLKKGVTDIEKLIMEPQDIRSNLPKELS
jgi:hypothetical protein